MIKEIFINVGKQKHEKCLLECNIWHQLKKKKKSKLYVQANKYSKLKQKAEQINITTGIIGPKI